MEKMRKLSSKLANEFSMSLAQMQKLSEAFYKDMYDKTTLSMLNTYMFLNQEAKDGKYLAIDFGGSNIRINYCQLIEGNVDVIKSILVKLRTDDYDYTTSDYTLSDVFDICAKQMADMNLGSDEILLGHTFSFATKATDKNTAKIIHMSKGFALKDAEGQDVNALLYESLVKYGLANVKPVCIINDTTATLLYGRYLYPDADIGCIVGTGHNMCYRNNEGEIINLESGAFNCKDVPLASFEKKLIEMVPNESIYLFDTLVGGKNICNLANIILDDAVKKGAINPIPHLKVKMLDEIIGQSFEELDTKQNYFLRHVSYAIYKKKACLVVAQIAGILKDIDPELTRTHTVVFDGSVYKYSSYFRWQIREMLKVMYGEKAKLIKTALSEDASSKGAIVACAI